MFKRIGVLALLLCAASSAAFAQILVNPNGVQSPRVLSEFKTGAGTSDAVSSSNPLPAALVAGTTGGVLRSRKLIPNDTTAIVVKALPGQIYKIRATNNSATIAYIKLYDAASATAGSGTPVDTIMIPANTSGAGIADEVTVGAVHATGIAYTVTTGIADNDTGAPAANTYIVTVFFK